MTLVYPLPQHYTMHYIHSYIVSCILVLFVLLLSTEAHSTPFYVSTNGLHKVPFASWTDAATNIQSAVDLSGNNDTVFVSNGLYILSSQLVIDKAIVLQSVGGPDLTIIDANDEFRCVYASAPNVEIDGFTIQNGFVSGVWPSNAGAGVFFNGGGVLRNSIVMFNEAEHGGGVCCFQGGVVTNCEVFANQANGNGGGVYCFQGGAVEASIIELNDADGLGGGIYCDITGSVRNCYVEGNMSELDGGGLYCYNGGTAVNCLIMDNDAWRSGGGVYCRRGGTVVNCTIVDNVADSLGNGVRCLSGGTLINCVIYFNDIVNYDDWGSGMSYLYCCTYPWISGEGNITNAPLFANYGASDYHLKLGSPCLDAGTNLPSVMGEKDIDGNPRVIFGRVDMGAYELVPEPDSIYYLLFLIGYLSLWRYE